MDNRENKIKKAYDSVRISEDSRQKVLDALLAQERKETVITMTQTGKNFRKKAVKHSASMIAAVFAAAVMTVTAGAYAYNQLFHKEGVAEYVGKETVEMIEEQGNALGQVAENEHFRMTLDTILSNGSNARLFMTVDALDDEAKEMLGKKSPNVRLRYADSNETLYIEQMELIDEPADGSFTFQIIVFSDNTDFSRKMILDFIDPNADFASLGTEEIPEEFFKGFEGLSFEADLSQNYEVAELHSEDGRLVRLSRAGVEVLREGAITEPDGEGYDEDEAPCVYLIRNDGTREKAEIFSEFVNFDDNGHTELYHGDIKDINEYSGVEVDGVLYTR